MRIGASEEATFQAFHNYHILIGQTTPASWGEVGRARLILG